MLSEMSKVDGFFSKSNTTAKRSATKAFVHLWCDATWRCEQDVFEAKWGTPNRSYETPTKKRRAMAMESMPIDKPPAVAESMPIDAPPAVAELNESLGSDRGV